MRYHRAPNPKDTGKLIVAERNGEGYWLDDFAIVSEFEVGYRENLNKPCSGI